MRQALLMAVFVLSACAHQQATVTREHEDQEAGSGGGFGFIASRYAREMALAFGNAKDGCQIGRDCFARSLYLSGGLTVGTSITSTGSMSALSYTATAGANVDALILAANAEIQWVAGTAATLSGTGDEVTAEGTFAVTGTLTFADARPPSTASMILASHVADAGTAFIMRASTNLTSGTLVSLLDNTATQLAYFDFAGALFLPSLNAFGAAALDYNAAAADGTTQHTIDTATDLTSGLHTSFRDNGTTALATVSFDGSIQAGTVLANEVTLAGAAGSSPVTVTATGSDTDIDVNVVPKGAGSLEVASREVAVFGNTGRAATIMCFGEKATSSGTVTITFANETCEAFGATPVCLCGNTSNTTENACSVTGESTTEATLNGTTSDTYTWVCFGAAP